MVLKSTNRFQPADHGEAKGPGVPDMIWPWHWARECVGLRPCEGFGINRSAL